MATPWNSSEKNIEKELDLWTRQAYFEDSNRCDEKYEYYHIGSVKWVLIDYNHQRKTDIGGDISPSKSSTLSEEIIIERIKVLNNKRLSDSKESDQISKKKQFKQESSSSPDLKILVPSRLNEMISNVTKTDMVQKNEGIISEKKVLNEETSGLRRTSQRILNNREKRRSQCENNDPTKRLKNDNLSIDPDTKSNGCIGDVITGTNLRITKPEISPNDPRLKSRIVSHLKDSKTNTISKVTSPTNAKNKNDSDKIFAESSIVRSSQRSFNSSIYAAPLINRFKMPDRVTKNVDETPRNVEFSTNIVGDIDKIMQQKKVKVLLPKRPSGEEVPIIRQTETSQISKSCDESNVKDVVKEDRYQASAEKGKNFRKKNLLSKRSKHNNKKNEKIVQNFPSPLVNGSKVLVREKHKTKTGAQSSLLKGTMRASEINSYKNNLKIVVSIGKNKIEPNILKTIKEIKSDLTDESVEKPPQITSENENLSKTGNDVQNQPFSDDIESNLAALDGVNSDDMFSNNNKRTNESVGGNNNDKNVRVRNERKISHPIETNADETQQNSSVQKDKCQKPQHDINQNSISSSETKNIQSITSLSEAVVTALTKTIDVNSNNSKNPFAVKDILNHGNSISINGESFYLIKVPMKDNNCEIDNTTENLSIPKCTDSKNSSSAGNVGDNKICNNFSQNVNETHNNSDHIINRSIDEKNCVPDHNISQHSNINVIEPVKNKDIEHAKPGTSCNNLQKKERSVTGNKEPVIEIDLTEDLFPEITNQFCNSFSCMDVKQESSESSLQNVSEVLVKEKFNENFNNLYKYMNVKKEEFDDDDDVIFVKEINSSLARKEKESLNEFFKEFAEIFQFFCLARTTKHCFEALQRVRSDNGLSVQFSLLHRDLPDQIDLNIKKGTKVIQNIKSVITDISWSPENIRQKIILPVFHIIIEKKPEVSLKDFEEFFFAFLKAKGRNELLESHKLTINHSSINENANNQITSTNSSQMPCRNTRPLVYCIPTDRLKSQSAEIFPRSAVSEQGFPICKPTCQPVTMTEPQTYNCSQSSQPKVNLLQFNDLISNQLSIPWSNSSNVHQLQQFRALDKGTTQPQQQLYPPSYQPPVRPSCIPCDSFPISYPPPPYPSLIPPPPYIPTYPSNQVNFRSSKNEETLQTASDRRNSSGTQKNHGNIHAGFVQRQLHAESLVDASMQIVNGDNNLNKRTSRNSKTTCQQKNTLNTKSSNTTNLLNQSLGQGNNISDLTSSAIERSTVLHSLHRNGTSLSSVSRSERNITIHNSETPKGQRIMRETSHHLSNFEKQAESDIFPCTVCTNPATLMCSNCCSIAYCSEICATKDWKKQHFQVCQKLQHSNFNSDKIQE